MPMLSEHGTYKTVKARLWPWFSGKILEIFSVVPSLLASGSANRAGSVKPFSKATDAGLCKAMGAPLQAGQ